MSIYQQTRPELPKWRCHKVVGAFKIGTIIQRNHPETGDELWWEIRSECNEHAALVADAYLRKHEPRLGGYYVRYEDGYESFSPAEAFESGYTAVEPEIVKCFLIGAAQTVAASLKTAMPVQIDIRSVCRNYIVTLGPDIARKILHANLSASSLSGLYYVRYADGSEDILSKDPRAA